MLTCEIPTRASTAAGWSYGLATCALVVVVVSDPSGSLWAVTLGLGSWANYIDDGAFLLWLATSTWAAWAATSLWSTTSARLVIATAAWGSALNWIGLLVVRHAEPATGYEDHSVVTAGFPLMAVVRLRDDRPGISELHRFYKGIDLDGSLLAFGLNSLLLAVVALAISACLSRRFARSLPLAGVAIALPATVAGMAFLRFTMPYPS